MSRTMSRTQSKVAPSKFCNVCKQAGKSEQEYTSHFTKSSATVVTCPMLLSQRCGWCRELGHTPKYCKKLANEKKYAQQQESNQKAIEAPKPTKPAPKPVAKITNKFEAFNDSEEKEEKKPASFSYATIASKILSRTVSSAPKINPNWAADEDSSDEDETTFVQSYHSEHSKLIRAEIGDEEFTNESVCDWESNECINSPVI